MTLNVSTENVYFGFIILLLVLQVSQWYYIFSLRKQMQAVWAQITTLALMFYAKESIKNEQPPTKE